MRDSAQPLPPPRIQAQRSVKRRELFLIITAATVVCVVLGVFGSLALRGAEFNANSQIVRTVFEYTARKTADCFQQTMLGAVEALQLLGATMSVFPDLSMAEFDDVSSVVKTAVRQQAVSWVPRIVGSVARAEWEARVSEAVGHNVTISELASNHQGFIPRPPQAEYFPIVYVSPLEPNINFLMVDFNSSPPDEAPLQDSLAAGVPWLAAPFALFQAQLSPGCPIGTLVYVPV